MGEIRALAHDLRPYALGKYKSTYLGSFNEGVIFLKPAMAELQRRKVKRTGLRFLFSSEPRVMSTCPVMWLATPRA